MAQEREELYHRRAERKVEARIGFYRHLVIFLVVNIGLVIFNMVLSPDALWFWFPLGGWGIGLVAHFLSVFLFQGQAFERWRSRQIEREARKAREAQEQAKGS